MILQLLPLERPGHPFIYVPQGHTSMKGWRRKQGLTPSELDLGAAGALWQPAVVLGVVALSKSRVS